MHKQKFLAISITLVMLLALAGPSFGVSAAPIQVDLRSTYGFAVLAGSGITNSTGPTTILGDVGTFPTTTENYPSTPTLIVPSVDHAGDSVTQAAKIDLVTVYNDIAGELPQISIAGPGIIGTATLGPGIYNSGSTINLNGALTLNAHGNPNAVFVFQAGSALTTASASSVTLIGGAQACNVYWQVTSSVHLGTHSHFIGTIVALQSITDDGGSTVIGRLLARNGAVTLSNTSLTRPLCQPTMTTKLSSSSITKGSAVHDSATLKGTTSTAGGTVTYFVFSNSACTALVGTAGVGTVTNGIVQNSPPFTFTKTGKYYWEAAYAGDAGNDTAYSVCSTEPLTVLAPTPTPAPASGSASGSASGAAVLPGTGFAPQRATLLSAQPATQSYADLGDLWLEIPRLGVQMPIVGVPEADGQWDVSWLGNDAGWLNSTAFPTYSGNSVMAGHVYNADGTPGPFVHLNELWWGDQVIVHAWGAQYIYEVRSVLQVTPGAVSSVITHKDLPWVTLITCRGYDEASNSYAYRVAVGAVLVTVK